MPNGVPSSELADAIMASAQRLGINPSDLATAISYETGGTFDPWKQGPRTQWGEHRGLIQFGEPQRQKYGYTEDAPLGKKFEAIEGYLKDAGVKPGMGLLDVYSAINAGKVGLYNRSDANNGGAPGTVADKVASMYGHRMRANALLSGKPFDVAMSRSRPSSGGSVSDPAPIITAGLSAPAAQGAGPSAGNLIESMGAIQKLLQPEEAAPLRPVEIPTPPGLARARALARAAAMRSIGAA